MPGQQDDKKNIARLIFTLGVIAAAVLISRFLPRHWTANGWGNSAQASTHAGPNAKIANDNATFELKRSTSWHEMDDPSNDGWHTEVFSAAAKKQLNHLVELFLSSDRPDPKDIQLLAVPQVSCWPFHPDQLDTVFEDRSLQIKRAKSNMEAIRQRQPGPHTGYGGLARAMDQLVQPFLDSRHRHFEIKVIDVQLAENMVTTRQLFSISAHTDTGDSSNMRPGLYSGPGELWPLHRAWPGSGSKRSSRFKALIILNRCLWIARNR